MRPILSSTPPAAWALAGLAVAALAAAAWLPTAGCGQGATALESLATVSTSAGDVRIRLHDEQVPATVARFAELARAGAYDGTRIDRIVRGVDIQQGGNATIETLPAIPDEFHPALRHDHAGVVSMANSGLGTGRGTFFITVAPAPDFDDSFSAFGDVVCGLDVVQAIAARDIEGSTFGPPREPVSILSVTVAPATGAPTGAHGVPAATTLTAQKGATSAVPAVFPILIRNTGDVGDIFTVAAAAPPGWTATLENGRVALPAGRGWVLLLTATPDASAQPGSVTVSVQSEQDPSASASLSLQVRPAVFGPVPSEGQNVTIRYTTLLDDGRIVSTTEAGLAGDGAHLVMPRAFKSAEATPYRYLVGTGVLPGFDALVQATPLGASSAGRVPAALGYPASGPAGFLHGRDLVVEVQVVTLG